MAPPIPFFGGAMAPLAPPVADPMVSSASQCQPLLEELAPQSLLGYEYSVLRKHLAAEAHELQVGRALGSIIRHCRQTIYAERLQMGISASAELRAALYK